MLAKPSKTQEMLPVVTLPSDMEGFMPPAERTRAWSIETEELLAGLTGLERAFCEWYCIHLNAHKAYMRASGRPDEGWRTRQLASKLKGRPAVAKAIESMMLDRSNIAIMDREYKLQVIKDKIEEMRESMDPLVLRTLGFYLRLAADLQGDIVQKKEVKVEHGAIERSRISVFISQIIAEAKGLEPGAKAPGSGADGSPAQGIARPALGAD